MNRFNQSGIIYIYKKNEKIYLEIFISHRADTDLTKSTAWKGWNGNGLSTHIPFESPG